MENLNLLFVDDEPAILRSVKMQFRKEGNIFSAESGVDAIKILRENEIHVVVSDQRMPNMTGVELLKEAKTVSPNTTRVLLTGYADLAAIVGSVNEAEVYKFVNITQRRINLVGYTCHQLSQSSHFFSLYQGRL